MPRAKKERCLPKQERSRRRYEAIVDAAAERFATLGFDATTMDAVASDAQTSIGSVYRFFPDKHALFRAVAERAMAHVEQTFRTAVAGAGAGQWRALLERSIDAFVELHERDFAARAVLTNMQLYGEYAEADQAMSRAFIVTTAALVRSWAPSLDDGQEDPALQPSKMLATVIIQTVSSMLIYSQSETPAVRVALFEHCKSMICGYLEPFLGGSPG